MEPVPSQQSGCYVDFCGTGGPRFVPRGSAAIEELLLSLLSDREKRVGLGGDYDDVSYKDPRICDMAALALSRRWPEKYSFKWGKSQSERDRQIEVTSSVGNANSRH